MTTMFTKQLEYAATQMKQMANDPELRPIYEECLALTRQYMDEIRAERDQDNIDEFFAERDAKNV